MKTAFINPPTRIGHMSFINKQYPLNIMILAAYLRSHGISAEIWDFNVERFSQEILIKKIEGWKPDIIGLTAFTSTINSAAHIAKTIKEYDPRIKTIIGGSHASALPEITLKEFPSFDLLVFGEGEITLLDTVESIKTDASLSKINGLCYRRNGEIIKNGPRDLIADIDTIPFPARDLILKDSYKGSAARGFLSEDAQTDYIITSRGCMGKCTFCAAKVISHNVLRFRSAENVLKEVKESKDKYHTKRIIIMDDTFTVSRKRLLEICDGLKKIGIAWNCLSRVDVVDEEKMKIMANSGCEGIQFGVESGSQRILDLMKKGITVEQIKQAFKWAHKYGIVTDTSVILGSHPSETREDIKMTERLIKEIKPKMFSCSILIPFPGTEINRIMKEKGYIKNENWDNYVIFGKRPPEYRTDHFTYEELRKIQNGLLVKFYLRPTFIINKILSIRSPKELSYWLKIGIDFIKEVVFRTSERD